MGGLELVMLVLLGIAICVLALGIMRSNQSVNTVENVVSRRLTDTTYENIDGTVDIVTSVGSTRRFPDNSTIPITWQINRTVVDDWSDED